MNLKIHRVCIACCFLFCLSIPVQAAGLTGPQVVAKCHAAYDGLTSYDGTVQAASASKTSTYATKSTAQITYRRPSLLEIEGTVLFPGAHKVTYSALSDGKTNWIDIGGHWSDVPDEQTAITACNGISQGAAGMVPSIVLHAASGAPSLFRASVPAVVARETVNGRSAYRIPVAQGPTTDTYWIDSKTFLFVKIVTTMAGFSSTKVFSTPVRYGAGGLTLAAIRKKMPHIQLHK